MAKIHVDALPWSTAGSSNRPWRTAVVKLSDRVQLDWFEPKLIDDSGHGDLAVSRLGTLAVASVTTGSGNSFVVASMYAPWEKPHESTNSGWIYSDASVHRVISDLSAFIGQQNKHRLIAAGDLNSIYGYGEFGSSYWASRYATIFDRMSSLGLKFSGPQAPDGRMADPWPNELPRDSKNVPTYHTTHQKSVSATRQLDFVFSSKSIADKVKTIALNGVEN